MTRYRATIFCVALAAILAPPALLRAQVSTSPAVEVFYIPHEDLSRTPGYSDAGAFLPLSEILALARQAQRPAEFETLPGGVYCPFIYLKGALGGALTLEGRIGFRAPAEGWSATLIDDGRMPWIAQNATTGTLAFLTRINSHTYLFAKGPTSGTLNVRALFPVAFSNSEATLSFGRFFAPCRIEADLGPNVQVTTSTVPTERSERPEARGEKKEVGSGRREAGLEKQRNTGQDISGSGERITIWPAQERATVLQLRRKAPLRGPSSLRVKLERTVEVVGGGLEVADDLVLEDRFAPRVPLKVSLPAGMALLRAEAKGPARLAVSSETLTLTPLEESNEFAIHAIFAAQMGERGATLGGWNFAALSQLATLSLRSSEQYASYLASRSPSLVPIGGSRSERRYECWGPLPPLEVALVRVAPPQPPAVSAALAIARNEATVQYDVKFSDKNRSEVRFSIPPEWVLTHFDARKGEASTPYTLQQVSAGRWRAAWDPAGPPERMRFTLHRVGAWGAPGTTATLAAPVVRLDGPRPSVYEMVISWPEELEARSTSLSGLAIIPLEKASSERPAGAAPKLALRATGDSPQGTLMVRGRDPDVQATVVSALAIGEDRAAVRAMIAYQVRLAPTNTFRFTLPAGTGPAVKIQGEGIRESTLRTSPGGDDWTVVTQQGVIGDYQLTLEWPLSARPAAEAIVAPEIRVSGVTSQRGFLLLEGSETLSLTAETKNLAEADLAELPLLPWTRESRVLAVYRYLQPPYLLRVDAKKFRPEPPLKALVRECELITTLAPEGERLTQASYAVAPTSDNQFLEIRLPKDAQVWSVLVNGQGVKPARSPSNDGGLTLLVPVPAARSGAADSFIAILYCEQGDPPADSSRVRFGGPSLSVPVNRTTWNLFLPPDFEYLTFTDNTGRTVAVREPAAHFFRAAYYPSRIVFMDMTIGAIIFLTLAGIGVVLIFRNPRVIVNILGKRIGPRTAETEIAEEAPPAEFAPEVTPPRAVPRSGCLGRLGVLLLVGFVICILAVISVPNFLEAQVRSKVSRARTDLRSLAMAVEAYFVDNNIPPERMERLYQGPVKYISAPPMDPFATYSSGQPYLHYLRADDPPWYWIAYSIGPDQIDNGGRIVYDPTNGTISAGDIIRLKDGAPFPFSPKYTALREKERGGFAVGISQPSARTPMPPPLTRAVPPGPKATLPPLAAPGGGPRAEIPPVSPARTFEERGRLGLERAAPVQAMIERMPTEQAPAQEPGQPAPEGYEVAGKPLVPRGAPPVARQAGLLSLQIEPLQSGTPRRFETLGGESRMEIRLLDWKQYRRLSFIVWIAAFLLMVAAWLIRPRAFRIVFVAAIAMTLIVPVAVQTAWVPFFNAAFQGVLFSLVAPLLSFLWRRFNKYLSGGATTALWLLLATLALGATNARAQSFEGSRVSLAAESPARVLVPYDSSQAKLPAALTQGSKEDPLAFISKEDFARLWNAAQRERPVTTRPAPILAEVRVEGRLVPDKSTIVGDVWFLAANPTSAPATLPLGLAGLTLQEWSARSPGASLEAGPNGLLLHLGANWVGTVSARFALPCETRGASGRVALAFPEAGAGVWRITIPYPGVVAQGVGARGCVSEKLDGATALTGPVRPGLFGLSWAASRLGEATSTAAAPGAPTGWQAEIATRVQWSTLSGAQWFSALDLRSTVVGRALPTEVRLALDPGLQIFSATGEELLGASVEPQSGAGAAAPAMKKGSELVLRLTDSQSAHIVLEGVVTLPPEDVADIGVSDGRHQTWFVPGLRAPEAVGSHTTLRLEMADTIEVLSVQPQRLERRSVSGALRGYTVQLYETAQRNWEAQVELRRLRPVFTANVSEVFVPFDGFLRQAASVGLSPRASTLHECIFEVPRGVRVAALEGARTAGWVQSGETVFVSFEPPIEQAVQLKLTATSDLPTSAAALTISPLTVRGATETRRSAAVFVSPDLELAELDLAKATPRPPTGEDEQLLRQLSVDERSGAGALRAYVLDSSAPLRFGLRSIEATSLETVFNRVVIGEGLQSLDGTVRAEPRRGRLRKVEALLLLPTPDPGAASRLQASGPALREFRTEAVSERVLRVVAEFNAPQIRPVDVRFHLDQPLALEDTKAVRAMIVVPVNRGGARVFLQLRRAFEGELTPAQTTDARVVDAAAVPWPDASFRPLPADRTFELSAAATTGPSFSITRHARSEALRAVVEVMRQRTILTADGFERHELEIVLQNQSEQFLKIALPYPKDRIAIYETQVASRVVKATFGAEGGREVLLVPLIRTGLLDPELTVRVAYTASGGSPLKGSGKREQCLPEILGGVPVAQSALVLMLPQNFSYSKFKGSLNQVELVDLEVDEALRGAKQAERLSELALSSEAQIQRKALARLQVMKPSLSSQITAAKQISEAQMREAKRSQADREERGRQEQLMTQRDIALKQAEQAAQKVEANVGQLGQVVAAQAPAQATGKAIELPRPFAAPAIAFPRVGDVFVFRQLQGTGKIAFRYASRESAGRRNDVLFAVALTLAVGVVTFGSRRLFASARRVALALVVLGLVALAFRVALDVTIPLVAVGLLILLLKRRKPAPRMV